MLARVYLALGVLGAAFGALCVRTLLRLPGRDPGEILVALVLLILAVAQTVPGAGLPAALWLRFPELHPRRWPRPVRAALVVAGSVLVVVDALFLGPLFLGPALALVGSAFVASRLALLQRRWVIGWLVASGCVVVLDAFACWVAWDVWRR